MNDTNDNTGSARRDFLKKAGKFAIYTPPAIMMLMHPSAHAVRGSMHGNNGHHGGGNNGHGKGNNGYGNDGHDGSPNGKQDINR